MLKLVRPRWEPVLLSRDKVLVKEAESVMAREGIDHKLAHEHRTGPWEVTEL